MIDVLLLVGPPGSGKDSVTAALQRIDCRFKYFHKLKVGSGRQSGYRLTDRESFEHACTAGEMMQHVARYGNQYGVDRPHLERILHTGGIPVIHVGRAADVAELQSKLTSREVATVLLDITREIAVERIRGRRTGDDEARLRLYDEDMPALSQPENAHLFDLTVDTSKVDPDGAARCIVQRLRISEKSLRAE